MPSDTKTQKLAKLVCDYSLNVKHNENVVISGSTEAEDFIRALYKTIIKKGAHPILRLTLPNLAPYFYRHARDHQLDKFPDHFDYLVKNAHKYIGIATDNNTRELTNANASKMARRNKIMQPITHYIVNAKDKIRRVTVGYPCPALAQEASMSADEYEQFVFNACLQDWQALGAKMNKILKAFQKGKQVQLIGKNVDLTFTIHGTKAIADKGEENMPGGEIFMAPVRDSANGWIRFEYPAIKSGKEVSDIYLKFNQGKVVSSSASKNTAFLKAMLTIDKNASYLGEFGIGCNPKIKKYTNNLLFDEKIGGTIHLALGMAYEENGGGNDSALHWDIVKDMHHAKIILDNKVLQENGIWKI